ncbi:MAG: alpha/beta fold hydrolase [Amaricoccus sp.]
MAILHHAGVSLHFRHAGEGAPVIALHGSASTGAQWRSLTGYIGGRFRVFTPDLPGCGRSEPVLGANGLIDDSRAIAALIERIGEPVHLVGVSYGAAVALKLASLRPAALRSLTLIEPVSFYLLRRGARADQELYNDVAGLAARIFSCSIDGDRVEAMRIFVDYWNGEGAWARTSAELQATLLGHLRRVCADLRAVMFEHQTLADLAELDCPTLAVLGGDSPYVSHRLAELITDAIPRATLRSVAGAGHLVALTDPHIVDPMVAEHLLAVDRARARAAAA